jgi:hypothetical protein
MFDNIKCEVTLPITKKVAKNFGDKDWTQVSFQTKNLDCTLSTYILKKNNTLVQQIEKNKWVPRKKEKGFRGFIEEIRKDKWKSLYEIVHLKTVYKKSKHTGVIHFYALEPDKNDDTWDLVFAAKFVDGVLVSLKFKSSSIWETSKETKKKNEQIRKLMEDSDRCLYNKIRRFLNKITLGYWRWTWNKVASFFSSTGNRISRLIHSYT